MKKKDIPITDYPSITEFIDRKMEDFNLSFERCFQSVFRDGRAEDIAEYAKKSIIKSYKY